MLHATPLHLFVHDRLKLTGLSPQPVERGRGRGLRRPSSHTHGTHVTRKAHTSHTVHLTTTTPCSYAAREKILDCRVPHLLHVKTVHTQHGHLHVTFALDASVDASVLY